MSTSCIIALYSKSDDEIVLLEKTHDGFFENFKGLILDARLNGFTDTEEIADYLLKNTDVQYSIYSHKYPHEAFIFLVDTGEFKTAEINPNINKISECLQDIRSELVKEQK